MLTLKVLFLGFAYNVFCLHWRRQIDIDRYLEFASVVDRLPKRDCWFAYDSEADVAYINFYSAP